VRQDLETWGQQQSALPLLVEKPGRTKAEAPRYWHGQSVIRQVEVEYSDGRIVSEARRFSWCIRAKAQFGFQGVDNIPWR
jgi:hypothetical protein